MTADEIIRICVSDYLDDGSHSDLWSDDFMLRALNEAQLQACNRTNLLWDDTTPEICQITLKTGVASYPFSQLITFIDRVIFNNGLLKVKCHQLAKHEIDHKIPNWRNLTGMIGKRIHYVVHGKTIRFTPTPDINDNGLIINLEVFRNPLKRIETTLDEPEIIEEYHRALIYWILHEAYKKQDADSFNQEKSDYYLHRFTEVFGEYVPAPVRINQLEQPVSLNLRTFGYAPSIRGETTNDHYDGDRL